MSLGFKQQYENEAVNSFARMVDIFSKFFPENKKLKAYAKEVVLQSIQLDMAEVREIRSRRSIVEDRRRECAECERDHGEKPCMSGGRPWGVGVCVYSTYEYNRAAIQKHFGEQGLQMLDYMDKWITKRMSEAEEMHGKSEDDQPHG